VANKTVKIYERVKVQEKWTDRPVSIPKLKADGTMYLKDASTILKCTELGQNLHMEWQPTTVDAVKKIIEGDLKECDDEQVSAFEKYAVEPYAAPILRYGKMESVVVVARRRDEVIYWEDVEEGFNRSPVAPDGRILEHWCNQDELRLALNA
jgi:hypothetical protein